MSFLTQLIIDKYDVARMGLTGLYEWHKLSWSLFPEKNANDKRDFITRLDMSANECEFIVLSECKSVKPDWCALENWKIKEVEEKFFQQQQYLFKANVNPVIALCKRDPKGNPKKRGSYYAILKKEELQEWLMEKGEKNGFRILDEPELEIAAPIFNKLYKKKNEGVIVGVEFKGALQVIDQNKFIRIAKEGIGRARGFGFGMLVIKPIQ